MISCVWGTQTEYLIVLPAASRHCNKSLLSGAFSSLTNLREALLLRIMAVLVPALSCEEFIAAGHEPNLVEVRSQPRVCPCQTLAALGMPSLDLPEPLIC